MEYYAHYCFSECYADDRPPPQRQLRNQRNRNPDFGVPQQNILFISQIELNN